MVKKSQRIKKKDTYKKKEKREDTKNNGKIIIKKHNIPRLGLGGLRLQRREESLRANHIEKYRKI
jgi:hypothetical protein